MHKCVMYKDIIDNKVEICLYFTKTKYTKIYDIVLKADNPEILYNIRHSNLSGVGMVMWNSAEKRYILVWDTYSRKKDALGVYNRIEKMLEV